MNRNIGTKYFLALVCCLAFVAVRADEGMWMMGNLNKPTRKALKELGLRLPAGKLYHPSKPSLKDAVVSFGGFCSGVVVSADGLVFTNHHCGFDCVQQHSSVERDYLKNGFVARTREEELPNPELYVRFLLRTEDVTRRVLRTVTPAMGEAERAAVVDSMRLLIAQEVSAQDSTLVGTVDAYYGGNEYWLSVYRDFNDVRLVYAPPSSVGKFGWDTDNWEWPRHTGDFCVFRIYADKQNRPADYAPGNVPYRPAYVAPVSLAGYREGSFCMTIGYPGTTHRYLSSYGIEEMMNNANRAQIDIRGVKQHIWKREMDKSDSIRIKYASKYAESSNYWKNSIGTNRALRKLRVPEKKRALEESLRAWIRNTPGERDELLNLFTELELGYKNRRASNRACAYFMESFLYGPELIQLTLKVLNLDLGAEKKAVEAVIKDIADQYVGYDAEIDKEVFAALAQAYRKQVNAADLPEFYREIDEKHGGNEYSFADSLYANSSLVTPLGLSLFLKQDSTYNILDDPAIAVGIDLLTKLFEMNLDMQASNAGIERNERLLDAAVRRMYASRNMYPDANGTMRLSFGKVAGYTPFDGAVYSHYTTAKGILEKVRARAGDTDFSVQPEIIDLLSAGEYGKYADEKGEMRVCFISDNDITGGNSGSAMFNARGELIGLAFDGNWEAISSDFLYEPKLQRTIGVDVRYMLFVMERYGGASHLIDELKFVP